MTKEVLLKAQELTNHSHYRKEDLKDIQYYEDKYPDYPIYLRLKRTKDNLFSDIDISDKKLKKEILNLVKTHFIADIQKCEKEIKEL